MRRKRSRKTVMLFNALTNQGKKNMKNEREIGEKEKKKERKKEKEQSARIIDPFQTIIITYISFLRILFFFSLSWKEESSPSFPASLFLHIFSSSSRPSTSHSLLLVTLLFLFLSLSVRQTFHILKREREKRWRPEKDEDGENMFVC